MRLVPLDGGPVGSRCKCEDPVRNILDKGVEVGHRGFLFLRSVPPTPPPQKIEKRNTKRNCGFSGKAKERKEEQRRANR